MVAYTFALAAGSPRKEGVEEEDGIPRSDCVDEDGSEVDRNMVCSRWSCCCCCWLAPCPCPCSSPPPPPGRVGDPAPLPGADQVEPLQPNSRRNIGRRCTCLWGVWADADAVSGDHGCLN